MKVFQNHKSQILRIFITFALLMVYNYLEVLLIENYFIIKFQKSNVDWYYIQFFAINNANVIQKIRYMIKINIKKYYFIKLHLVKTCKVWLMKKLYFNLNFTSFFANCSLSLVSMYIKIVIFLNLRKNRKS